MTVEPAAGLDDCHAGRGALRLLGGQLPQLGQIPAPRLERARAGLLLELADLGLRQVVGVERALARPVDGGGRKHRPGVAGGEELVVVDGPLEQVELAAVEHIGRVGAGSRPAAANLTAILDAHHAGVAHKRIFAERGHAAVAVSVALDVVEQLARLPIQPRREGAAVGHQQLVAAHQQVALWRQTGFEERVVVDAHLREVVAVAVDPQHLAGLRVDGQHEHAERGPDPRREVHHAVRQHRPAADRPERDEPVVAQVAVVGPVLRRPAKLPQQLAVGGVEAVQVAIVRTEVQLPLPHHRGEAHGAFRVEAPLLLTGLRVVRGDAALVGRPEKQRLPCDDRFVRRVEVQPRFVRPRALHPWQFAGPLEMQLGREAFGGGGRPADIAAPHRPVCGGCEGEGQQDPEAGEDEWGVPVHRGLPSRGKRGGRNGRKAERRRQAGASLLPSSPFTRSTACRISMTPKGFFMQASAPLASASLRMSSVAYPVITMIRMSG